MWMTALQEQICWGCYSPTWTTQCSSQQRLHASSQVEDHWPESQRNHTQGTPGIWATTCHWGPCRAAQSLGSALGHSLHVATPQLGQVIEPSKRSVASDIARTFDVLGWFAPANVALKVLIQLLWQLQSWLGWAYSWRHRWAVACLVSRTPPGNYLLCSQPIHFELSCQRHETQLHGFSDVSEQAFAGVVYLRATYTDTATSTTIVMAKSKVAPLKSRTIPKLQLSAADLLAKLLKRCMEQLQIRRHHFHGVIQPISWVGSVPHSPTQSVRFKQSGCCNGSFASSHWRHVGTTENPADYASRGIRISKLLNAKLLWEGPPWLLLPSDKWPSQQFLQQDPLPEMKPLVTTVESKPSLEDMPLVLQYSSFRQATWILSLVRRFVDNRRKKLSDRDLSATISQEELKLTEENIYHYHQREFFPDELRKLQAGRPVTNHSRLLPLRPYLDERRLLRVGWWLSQASICLFVWQVCTGRTYRETASCWPPSCGSIYTPWCSVLNPSHHMC